MADDRRRRFSQIERPRAPGAAPLDQSPGTGTRFGAVVEPGAAPADGPPGGEAAANPAGPVSRGHTDRFRPAAERPLEVDERTDASQPFIRCAHCETDSSRYAARCTTCGEPLDTDAQRAFNARLWGERQVQAAAEAGQQAARQAALEEARLVAAAAQRGMGEALAREVGERERRRLDAEGFGTPTFGPPGGGFGGEGRWGQGGGWGGGLGGLFGGGAPIGLRLLGLLPVGWRVAVGVGLVALAAGLFLLAPAAGLVATVLLVSSFTPGRARWGRRSWW